MTNSNTNQSYSASGYIKFGDFYGGKIWLLNPASHFIFSKHFTLDLNYQFVQIKFPDSYCQNNDSVYTSHLLNVKLGYFLSTKLNLKLLTRTMLKAGGLAPTTVSVTIPGKELTCIL